VLLLLVGDAAKASAWNEPVGTGLVIGDVTFSGGAHYFNGLGRLAPATLYEKHDLFGYLEYGLTDQVMILLKPDLMTTAVGASNAAHYAGLGTSEAGVQLHLLTLGSSVLAASVSGGVPGTMSQRNPALIGNTCFDVDGRVLLGVPFRLGSWPAFVDVQAAYRDRSSGAPGEWHADVTIGARPVPQLLVLAQSFSTLAIGKGTAWFPASSYSKISLSGVFALSSAWSVQIGIFSTVGGIDALRERGFQTGLWYRF
jgi:hypothetical protein